MPFGGRAEELACLDRWLGEKAAPARLLLTAPAGRGKSALVVRWVAALATAPAGDDPWQVAFVPISIRKATNSGAVFMQALATRLADVLDETLIAPVANVEEHYADKATALLRRIDKGGPRVLVVIDGVDEALGGRFNADFFPRGAGTNLKILLSARLQGDDTDGQGWLRRLRWSRGVKVELMDLPALGEAGIADVLRGMGAPVDHLGDRAPVVRKLAQLTEGEPLLLRYYAEDLWKAGPDASRLTEADLAKMRPGFEAYFSQWLEDQQEAWEREGREIDRDGVDATLAILACACGPLEANDLARLVQDFGRRGAVSIGGLLDPVQRFVMGDGSEEGGYVLNHPKIAGYLREQYLLDDAEARALTCFTAWGRATLARLNAGDAAAVRVPRYLLQFHLQHLDESGAPLEAYREVVEQGWLRAWKPVEDGAQGFSRDVETVWQRLRAAAKADRSVLKKPRVGLGGQIRCVLFMTSVRSVGAQMSPEVLVELVRANVIRPKLALYYVMLKDDRQRGAALRELVPLLPENLHGQAIDVARSIVRADDQARSLMQVASVARGTRQVEARAGAVSAASRVTDARTRVGLLRELQKDLPDELSAEVSELLERAAAGEAKQGPTVPAVGENPADPEAAGDQRTEWDLAFELLHAAASGDASVVRDAWERALRMADTVARAHALVGLVRRIPEDVLVRVPALLRAMEPGYRRMELIEAVAPRLSPAMADELAELAVATSRYYYLSKELSALAPRMTSGLRRRLLAAVTTETYGDVVAAIAPALADDELTEAWALASSIPNRYLRREGVKALAERVTAGLIRPLLLDVNRAASVLEVLDVLPPALLTEISGDAIETAARLGESEARASTVKALAKWLPQEQLPDLVALAAGIADADARAGALGALAPRLRDAERPDLLKEIHESSLVVGDAELIAAALTSLLPAASPAVRDRVESFVEPVVGPSRTRPPGDDVQSTLTTIFALLLRLSFTRGDARRPLVKALRAASDSVRELDGRAFVMAAVARHTATDDDSILAKARDLGSTRDDENLKRWFAAMIAPVLDPSDRDATVTQMRQVAAEATADGAIDDDKAVMFVISSLLIAPHLPTDFDAIARDLIAKMADPDHRVVMDALYTGRAGGGDVARAMAARMQTTDPISRSVVPLLLVPRLGEDHDCFPILDDALAQCAAIGPRMSVALGIAFVEGGIDRLLATAETSGRIVTKSLLARVGGEYAVTETADALIDASRWWP